MSGYSDGIDYLHSKIAEQRITVLDHMARGTLEDFGEYKRLCGVIQGLDYANQIVSDLAKNLEADLDE
jgi:hypothetical protein